LKFLLIGGLGYAAAAFALSYDLSEGTKIPLSLINSISTKQAVEGDRVYMETAFPVLEKGKIIIPVGSYVAGTVTRVKRPGRLKGRAELFIRFDSITLPNGVTRDFRARIGGLDGQANEKLDRQEGTIRGDSNKGGDARTVGEAAGVGTSVGAITGSVAGHTGMGVGIGAAAGAAAGLVGVLASRGPEAVLARGSTLEMVLDRTLSFDETELDFSGPGIGGSSRRIQPVQPAASTQPRQGIPMPGRGIPGSRRQ
jgi:type IV secretion system protein VirB10